MAKQVNLFSQDLLPGYGPVQLPYFIVCALLSLLVGMVLITLAIQTRQQLLLEQQLWQANAKQQADALALYQQQHPSVQNIEQLSARNAENTLLLQQRQRTYQDITAQLAGSVDGFSRALQELTDYDINGLWLDSIELTEGQRAFTLSGFARSPELIPSYLSQLGQSSFQGLSISHLSVSKSSDQQSLWRFSLSNTPAGQAPRAQ